MSVIASDNFVRADNADLGANWTPNQDSFKIVSNTARPSSNPSDSCERWSAASFPSRQYSKVTFSATSADGLGAGVGAACMCDTGGAATFIRAVGCASGYEIARINAGGFTSLKSSAATTFAGGDSLTLDYNGATGDWNLSKNDVQFDSGTDGSPLAAGSAGVSHSSSTTAGTGLSAFEGGDFGAAILNLIAPTILV